MAAAKGKVIVRRVLATRFQLCTTIVMAISLGRTGQFATRLPSKSIGATVYRLHTPYRQIPLRKKIAVHARFAPYQRKFAGPADTSHSCQIQTSARLLN